MFTYFFLKTTNYIVEENSNFLLMAAWFLRLQFTDSGIGTRKNRVALPRPYQVEKKQQNKGLWITAICNLQGKFNSNISFRFVE